MGSGTNGNGVIDISKPDVISSSASIRPVTNTTATSAFNVTRGDFVYSPPDDPTTLVRFYDFNPRPSIKFQYLSVLPYDIRDAAIRDAADYNLEPDDPVHEQTFTFTKKYGDQTVGFDMVGLKEGFNQRGIYYDDMRGLMVRAIQAYQQWIGVGHDLPQAEIYFETQGGEVLAGTGSLFVDGRPFASA
ncbi:MAG: hypothetical protein OHK93_004639 [Ramalina farinacea]|uniref:Uncharacterized protein n=1 Tax=Ramalina farinacea TaxID=258253 RepID=A0AA43TV84_9LECA|nr:hypothetical protein [Ramalina farinacea]